MGILAIPHLRSDLPCILAHKYGDNRRDPGYAHIREACGWFSRRRSLAPDFREQRLVRSYSEEPGTSDDADVLL